MKITALRARDVRFPTSRERDGSDALNVGDYSAVYVTLETDTPQAGCGLTFTNGRGTEIGVAAARAFAPLVAGRRLSMDANQCWDVGEAIEQVKALARFDPFWIEEPTSPDDVLGHAAIPHAGGVGLCEYVQHLALYDYVALNPSIEGRYCEYVDHLHEHFVHPVRVVKARYQPPLEPGYSIEMKVPSLAAHEYPTGAVWREGVRL